MSDINKINKLFGTKLTEDRDVAGKAKEKTVSKAKAVTRVNDSKRTIREQQYNNAEINKRQTKKQGG